MFSGISSVMVQMEEWVVILEKVGGSADDAPPTLTDAHAISALFS